MKFYNFLLIEHNTIQIYNCYEQKPLNLCYKYIIIVYIIANIPFKKLQKSYTYTQLLTFLINNFYEILLCSLVIRCPYKKCDFLKFLFTTNLSAPIIY